MTDTEQPNNVPNKGHSLIGRLLIAAFMATIIASECLFAYFWLPSAEDVAAQVERIAQEAEAGTAGDQETQENTAISEIEVDLGNFTVTNHRLPTESTFRTDFHLWGTVREGDEAEFLQLFERNEQRFRDQVIREIRNCQVSDLEDAGLGLIKRRFLEKSNALLGKPLLRSILFADYTFVEL